MKLILIGFATSYKTSVGKKLSQKLALDFFDVDKLIEQQANMTVQQIFETFGESHFRDMENATLRHLAQKQHCVISCGGGSALSEQFNLLKKDAIVVWLKVSAQTAHCRLNGKTRPLFDNLTLEQLQEKLQKRDKVYQSLCDVTISTDNKNSLQVTNQVLKILKNKSVIK